MPEEIQLTLEDEAQRVPAARCRRCGVVTWMCSLLEGMIKLERARHHMGCPMPAGRLDLKILAEALPRRQRSVWGHRLDRMMRDSEVKTLVDELLAEVGERHEGTEE